MKRILSGMASVFAFAVILSFSIVPLALAQGGTSLDGMVYVPGGSFWMGSDDGAPDETPKRKVYVFSFYIDDHEVTNREYYEFVKATGHPTPENPSDPSKSIWKNGTFPPDLADHPVVNVSWRDAAEYAAWCGRRLPIEAEWEKAARGTKGQKYPWGNRFDSKRCNVRGNGTAPVKSNKGDLSPYGCYDMAGNVAEWTADWYKRYPGNMHKSLQYGEKFRVIRGGAWDYLVNSPRAAARWPVPPDVCTTFYGFRCVISQSTWHAERSKFILRDSLLTWLHK